jgi:flagella basal body P-ring formation protein FlgA
MSMGRIISISALKSISIILLIASNPLQAAEFQSIASIQIQAETFVHEFPYQSPYPPRFKLGVLDNRLRLKYCRKSLKISFSNELRNRGNTSLRVECDQIGGWKIHLPVSVDIFDNVLVSSRPLVKGQLIDDNVVKFEKNNVSRLNRGYYTRSDDLQFLEVSRNLKRGVILTPGNLKPRMMVKSGQTVTLILNYKGIQIKSSGQALRSARMGQIVKVRNNQSQRIVEGIVSGEAQVKINI